MKLIILDPDTIDYDGHYYHLSQGMINRSILNDYQTFLLTNIKKNVKFTNNHHDFNIINFKSHEYSDQNYEFNIKKIFLFIDVLLSRYKGNYNFFYYLGNYFFLKELFKYLDKYSGINFYINLFDYQFNKNLISSYEILNNSKKFRNLTILSDSRSFRDLIKTKLNYQIYKFPLAYLRSNF